MSLIEKLKRPFVKRIDKVTGMFRGFVQPIKSAIQSLRGKLPNAKGFAGSEDLGEVPAKVGLGARLKIFKEKFSGLSDLQKLVLLTIAVCLPAGILISTMLVKALKRRP
ncbi:hypothetical protein [Fibrobacter sp.]|uniref:hypothetical protein n=1 Tax=Fibrobacter sp. TaxID=35828 RepID=UPI00388F601F